MVGGPYDVDWDNDGTFDEFGLNGHVTHDFGAAGIFTIRIQGTYDSIRFNFDLDREKIVSLNQWGTNSWTTMDRAFEGASNLEVPATDTPDFSAVTSMRRMFSFATIANPDTSQWDTSNVTDMSRMFSGTTAANPDTSGWNTSSVTNMRQIFSGATAFDRDLGGWEVSALLDATDMFEGIALSNPNYDNLLIGWNGQALQPGVVFDGGNSVFCSDAAIAARTAMIDNDGWSITDGGRCALPVPTTDRYGLLLLLSLILITMFIGQKNAMASRV